MKMDKAQLKTLKNIIFILLIFSHTHITICNGFFFLGSDSLTSPDFDPMVGSVCGKNIGECTTSELGSEEGEVKRRALVVQKRYISYATLKRDLVPCKKPGASYYNCRAASEANPYNRGCEFITGCARDISEINS